MGDGPILADSETTVHGYLRAPVGAGPALRTPIEL
jgi:hypothetical protein